MSGSDSGLRSSSDPARPAPASWALGIAAVVGVVTGLLAAVPLAFTLLGVIGVVALLQHRWDATWNDGDLAFSAVGLVVLLVLLAAAWGAGRAVARRARLRARLVGPATAAAALLVAIVVSAGAGFFGR